MAAPDFGCTPEEQADADLAKLLKEGIRPDSIPFGIESLCRAPDMPETAAADVWLAYANTGPDVRWARATIHRVERGGAVAIDLERTRRDLAADIARCRAELVGVVS